MTPTCSFAYDTRDTLKQATAIEVVRSLTNGVLLWQVACEFIAASRKLSDQGLNAELAWAHLEDLRQLLPLVLPTSNVLQLARQMHAEKKVQFWDAMIHAACIDAGAKRLYSEDLPGHAAHTFEIVNPFT